MLRSDYLHYQKNDQNNMENECNAWDFIGINSVVAFAASEKSADTVWFIKISENVGDEYSTDDYFNHIIINDLLNL